MNIVFVVILSVVALAIIAFVYVTVRTRRAPINLPKEGRQIPNDQLMKGVDNMLQEGRAAIIFVKGYSMLPFIIGGVESVRLRKPEGNLKVGNVVLARVLEGYYVIHRIYHIPPQGGIILMGDGNCGNGRDRGVEHTTASLVVGIATEVIGKNGDERSLYTPWRNMKATGWRWLLPVRRWLLAIYRRTALKWKAKGVDMKGQKIEN